MCLDCRLLCNREEEQGDGVGGSEGDHDGLERVY